MSNRQAVSFFFFINGFVFASWAARLPYIQDLYGLDHRGISFILLAYSIGAFVAMPITGWLISRYSSNVVTRWSGLLFPICFAAISLMNSFEMLLIPFALMGVATGIMDISMNAQAVEVEKDLKKPIMTTFHAMFSIGMVVGGLSAGWFVTEGSTLQEHFWPIAVIAFVILVLAGRNLFIDTIESAVNEPWIILPKGIIIGLGVIAFCCMMGEGAMSDWSTNYMKNVVTAGLSFQTLGLTAFASLMTVGRLIGDRARGRYGDAKVLIMSGILSLLGMFSVLAALEEISVIIGFGIVGLGLSNIVPVVFSLAGSMPGIKPGVGIAMASTIGYMGFMFGPPIIGFVADAFNLRVGMSVLFILFVIMTVLILSYSRKRDLH